MARQSKATDWAEIEIDTLPATLKKSYAQYKAKQKEAAEARNSFENMARAFYHKANSVPAGHDVIFGHNFGKLSRAWVPGEVAAVAAKRTAKKFGE